MHLWTWEIAKMFIGHHIIKLENDSLRVSDLGSRLPEWSVCVCIKDSFERLKTARCNTDRPTIEFERH